QFDDGYLEYQAEDHAAGTPEHFIADAQALDERHLLLIERDDGRGQAAVFRSVYEVDLRDVGADGFVSKEQVVDLADIPDPHLLSQPPIHEGDVGLATATTGFRVTCESIEALHVISHNQLLLGCDNNFPNTGRNPALADDNEFITVRI